jgi:tripartite-type tricarboxylate transporter receptor subunit TctC
MKTAVRIAGLLALLIVGGASYAQTAAVAPVYPAKAVRVIVPYPPGGMDLIARVTAEKLSQALGTPFHVENLPGAGGTIGTGTAANAPADGSTVLVMNQDFVIQPIVKAKVPYDLAKSFTPVTLIATAPETILVHPSVPARNIQELIALLKENPGKYSYATPGYGTSPHLACERLFRLSYGLDVTHVPFQGAAPAITSTIAGHTQILHITAPLVAQQVKDGMLRALAVASSERSSVFPDVPTLAETGVPNHEVGFWMGVMVPAGTPNPIVEILQHQIVRILSLPEVKERLATLGLDPIGSTPEALANHINTQFLEWSKVARDAHLKID